MFKNLIVYRIAPLFSLDLLDVQADLARAPFTPCGPTQERSCGWVPPRGEANGALVESVGGQWVAKLFTETKDVPAQVLARRVQEKAARIEQETGRKLGRKSKELKEEAKLDLLPMAFTKQSAVLVWIDPAARTLAIGASSQSRADEVVCALVACVQPGLYVSLLDTQTSPQAAMAHWLSTQEAPPGFSIDRECELKSESEEKSVVRYGRHPLDIEEVQAHIAAGKLPTKLALTWSDGVSFVLTEGLQLRKLEFLAAAPDDADNSGFDTNVAIATLAMKLLIVDLIGALGGESVRSAGGAA